MSSVLSYSVMPSDTRTSTWSIGVVNGGDRMAIRSRSAAAPRVSGIKLWCSNRRAAKSPKSRKLGHQDLFQIQTERAKQKGHHEGKEIHILGQ